MVVTSMHCVVLRPLRIYHHAADRIGDPPVAHQMRRLRLAMASVSAMVVLRVAALGGALESLVVIWRCHACLPDGAFRRSLNHS
jgi:hypothetical protein